MQPISLEDHNRVSFWSVVRRKRISTSSLNICHFCSSHTHCNTCWNRDVTIVWNIWLPCSSDLKHSFELTSSLSYARKLSWASNVTDLHTWYHTHTHAHGRSLCRDHEMSKRLPHFPFFFSFLPLGLQFKRLSTFEGDLCGTGSHIVGSCAHNRPSSFVALLTALFSELYKTCCRPCNGVVLFF